MMAICAESYSGAIVAIRHSCQILAALLFLSSVCHGFEQRFYIVCPNDGGRSWEIVRECGDEASAIAEYDNARTGRRCVLILASVFDSPQPGSAPLPGGARHLVLAELTSQGGVFRSAAANVNREPVLKEIRRNIESAAPLTVKPHADSARPNQSDRPIYVIAHRCNAPADIEAALAAGANAVECDVRYIDGQWCVQHDPLAGRTQLDEWLTAAANSKAQNLTNFALIEFDIKTPCPNELADLLNRARGKLPGRALRTALMFSVAEYENRNNAFSVIGRMLDNDTGLMIDKHISPREVQDYFVNALGVGNFWYGYGTCVVCPDPVEEYVRAGCEVRDQDNAIKKVCVWTLRDHDSITHYIRDLRVDCLLVNQPQIAFAVTTAKQYGRMATARDNPFERYGE